MQGFHRTEFPKCYWLPRRLELALKETGWKDASWGNDSCPKFQRRGWTIWCDARNPKLREMGDIRRYAVLATGEYQVFLTDSTDELIRWLRENKPGTKYSRLAGLPVSPKNFIQIGSPRHRRDWSSWLVAADQHEEAGLISAEEANLWRRRGELMRGITELVKKAMHKAPNVWGKGARMDFKGRGGDVDLKARLTPRRVFVRIKLPATANETHRGAWFELQLVRSILQDPKRTDYLPERIITELFVDYRGF